MKKAIDDNTQIQRITEVKVEAGAFYVAEIHNLIVADSSEMVSQLKKEMLMAAPTLQMSHNHPVTAHKVDDATLSTMAKVQPQHTNDADGTTSNFGALYVLKPEKADVVMKKLHEMIDSKLNPKQRLLPLRAAIEAQVVAYQIRYKDFVAEFGEIKTSSYYAWLNKKSFSQEEIDPLIEIFAKL